MMTGRLRLIAVVFVRIVRWWFGLTYLACGAGAFIAGPIMIGLGDYGGLYMIVGGPIIVVMGWIVHPWGLQRAMKRPTPAAAPAVFLPPEQSGQESSRRG